MAVRSASCTRFHCRTAKAFWRNALGSADRGERIVLGAFDGEELIGTVTLLLNLAQNQPHRAEIVKMMTRVSHRHRGIATALLREAERSRSSAGAGCWCSTPPRTRARPDSTSGWDFSSTGLIPDYALKPHGGLTGTLIYWKRLQERVLA